MIHAQGDCRMQFGYVAEKRLILSRVLACLLQWGDATAHLSLTKKIKGKS